MYSNCVGDGQGELRAGAVDIAPEKVTLTAKDWYYASEFGIVKTDRADILLESDQYNERRFLTGIGANALREIVDGANRPVDEAFVDPDILRQHNPGTKQ